MTTTGEILDAKSALKELVDTFSILADERRISDQMRLFTPDARLRVHLGDELAFDLSGTEELADAFTAFTANVTRTYHLNGQQVVQVDGDRATGISYCRLKQVGTENGRQVVTDSCIRYDDEYVRRDGRWLIRARVARFTINDKRQLDG